MTAEMKKILITATTILLLFVAGCSTGISPRPKPPLPPEKLTTTEYIEVIKEVVKLETTVKNLGWVQGILVVGAVGSVFACFMGAAKFGAPALASCLVGYGLLSAGIHYGEWIALVGFVGGVGVCAWAMWKNYKYPSNSKEWALKNLKKLKKKL